MELDLYQKINVNRVKVFLAQYQWKCISKKEDYEIWYNKKFAKKTYGRLCLPIEESLYYSERMKRIIEQLSKGLKITEYDLITVFLSNKGIYERDRSTLIYRKNLVNGTGINKPVLTKSIYTNNWNINLVAFHSFKPRRIGNDRLKLLKQSLENLLNSLSGKPKKLYLNTQIRNDYMFYISYSLSDYYLYNSDNSINVIEQFTELLSKKETSDDLKPSDKFEVSQIKLFYEFLTLCYDLGFNDKVDIISD